MREDGLERAEAVERLAEHGITGVEVYLIDVIPLIEMIWADGQAQDEEVELMRDFLRRHVDHVNALAGRAILAQEQASAFVDRFLHEPPPPEVLRALRNLVRPVRLTNSDPAVNASLRRSLLAACLDIAASAVVAYPYGRGERFDALEKLAYFEILDSLYGG